jgi:hypothetical protein
MELGLEITGVRELDDYLRQLPQRMARTGARRAVEGALEPQRVAQVQQVMSMYGGRMGQLIAAALAAGRLGHQRAGGYSAATKLKRDEVFIHFTLGSAWSRHEKQSRHGYRYIVESQVAGNRYFIPAAIEFGHAFPGRGGKSVKDVRPLPALATGAEMAAPRTIAELVRLIREFLEEAKMEDLV